MVTELGYENSRLSQQKRTGGFRMIKMGSDVLPERAGGQKCCVGMGMEGGNESGGYYGAESTAEVPFSPLHVSVMCRYWGRVKMDALMSAYSELLARSTLSGNIV